MWEESIHWPRRSSWSHRFRIPRALKMASSTKAERSDGRVGSAILLTVGRKRISMPESRPRMPPIGILTGTLTQNAPT
jgi:hypothetical protein